MTALLSSSVELGSERALGIEAASFFEERKKDTAESPIPDFSSGKRPNQEDSNLLPEGEQIKFRGIVFKLLIIHTIL
jgi:hypothetical protein